MKTIGLIGGMSWESTVTYYQVINETIKEQLGGFHSAKILMYSVDFAEMEEHMSNGNWAGCASVLVDAAKRLEKAGADFILVCTNTMHKMAPEIEANINIPLLHIAQAAADELKERNMTKAALLGTKYTMQQDFYRNKLDENGIEVIIPEDDDIEVVNDIIFNELCLGVIKEESKKEYLRIIDNLAQRGAQGIILGCTEIGLLIEQQDTETPVFDTTIIHGKKAALLAVK